MTIETARARLAITAWALGAISVGWVIEGNPLVAGLAAGIALVFLGMSES